MKNVFRSVLFLFCFFAITQANAQISVGAGLVYGTEIDNIGISVNGKYAFNEQWSAAPSFTYFLEKDMMNWSSLDLDANYQLMPIESLGSLYALGGLNITFWKFDYDLGEWGEWDASDSEAGINLGLGLDIPAGDKLSIAPEVRYTFGGADYLRLGVKLMFAL